MNRIAWFAGLLEGEGSFDIQRRLGEKRHDRPRIQFSSTDQDTAAKVAALWRKKINGPYKQSSKLSKLPIYRVNVSGPRAAGWMMTLFSLMGHRRKAQIKAALEVFRG